MASRSDAPSPDSSPSEESSEDTADADDPLPPAGADTPRPASEQARLEVDILREALGIEESSPGDASENESENPP